MASSAAEAGDEPVSYTMTITLDPEGRTLSGTAEIRVPRVQGFDLLLGPGFDLADLRVNDTPTRTRPVTEGRVKRWRIPAGAPERVLTLRWHGQLSPLPRNLSHQDTLGWRAPTADPDGSYLPASSLWYPVVAFDGKIAPHRYVATLDLPQGQRALVAGTLVRESDESGRNVALYRFEQPSRGVDLIAGPYRSSRRTVQSVDGRDINLRTLFHAEIDELSSGYLDAIAGYLALYESWIGPYPYETFSVVSSPTPTGLGMPTFTYLGIQVLALPFIRATSLGHEVLHNWWGNGVFPDYEAGNWSEGLTTFMADYHYAKGQGAERAREMRLGWLRELSAVPDGAATPLISFTARHHGVSQAVGYSKAAMLFVMLRDRIGQDAFDRGIRRFWSEQAFRIAAWDALRTAFEIESGQDLNRFFDQWLTWRGLPSVALHAARNVADGVEITLAQASPIYDLDVPVRIDRADGFETVSLRLDQASRTFFVPVSASATRVRLDPDSRMLRRMDAFEAPPILRELQFASESGLLVLGDDPAIRAHAQTLSARILESAPHPIDPLQPPHDRPLLVIGSQPAIEWWLTRHTLPAVPAEVADRGDLRMWTIRLASGAPVGLIAADSAAALEQALRPLPHYRQQSWLVVDEGRVQSRGVWPANVPTLELDTP
ncbi:M1 family metallopeptidase [Rhodocyclaceae bacterium SMB388]